MMPRRELLTTIYRFPSPPSPLALSSKSGGIRRGSHSVTHPLFHPTPAGAQEGKV